VTQKVLSRYTVYSDHSIATSVLNLYPNSIKIRHLLKWSDFAKRIKLAEWFLEDPFKARFFTPTHEAYFHLDGNVNNYNLRILGQNNPNVVVKNQLKLPKIHVWCRISSNKIRRMFLFQLKS
jgi:hypothetical protein